MKLRELIEIRNSKLFKKLSIDAQNAVHREILRREIYKLSKKIKAL